MLSDGDMAFLYDGDMLRSCVRGADTLHFVHDAMGRMTRDGYSGTNISYNMLDLPSVIISDGGNAVNYSFLSDGTKLSSLTDDGSGLVYRGPFIYRRDSAGVLTFESASIEGGRMEAEESYLHLTDRLGSTRAVAALGGGPVGDVADYSSHGERRRLHGQNMTRLHFTGKEDQEVDFGLPYTDFGARHYSPGLRRWLRPDPLGAETPEVSPYAYCAADPVNFIDPDGETSYNVNGSLSVIEDGYYDQVSVSERQFKALTRLWNSGKGKRYDDRRQKFMDASGYIDGSGNWVLSASRKTDLYSPKNGESAVVMAFISRDLAIDEPSDACAPKWLFYGAFALAAHEYDYYVAKQQRELERIDQRPDGPEGVMYSLRAARSGYYPNVRGGMVYLNEGDVWKYGKTTQQPPENRYGGKQKIKSMGFEMHVEQSGTQKQMKRAENIALYKYFLSNYTLPPGNSIFR